MPLERRARPPGCPRPSKAARVGRGRCRAAAGGGWGGATASPSSFVRDQGVPPAGRGRAGAVPLPAVLGAVALPDLAVRCHRPALPPRGAGPAGCLGVGGGRSGAVRRRLTARPRPAQLRESHFALQPHGAQGTERRRSGREAPIASPGQRAVLNPSAASRSTGTKGKGAGSGAVQGALGVMVQRPPLGWGDGPSCSVSFLCRASVAGDPAEEPATAEQNLRALTGSDCTRRCFACL